MRSSSLLVWRRFGSRGRGVAGSLLARRRTGARPLAGWVSVRGQGCSASRTQSSTGAPWGSVAMGRMTAVGLGWGLWMSGGGLGGSVLVRGWALVLLHVSVCASLLYV